MHTKLTVDIIDYGMNGEGVAKLDGKIILVPYTLIGETVEVEITEDKGNYAHAKLINVIKPSTYRTIPACNNFYKCGGCDLQHMKYEEQIKFKQMLVQKTIKKICNLQINVNSTIPCSTSFEYRNKISTNANIFTFGFYKENSKQLVEIDSCILANDSINSINSVCKEYFKKNKLQIKNIVIRQIENQTLVGIVSNAKLDLTNLLTELSNKFKNIGLFNVVNSRKDSVVLSGKTYHIGGIKEIQISNFGLTYSVDLLGFHQTNIDIQNKIYEKVLEYIPENSTVVNGFSGQGLLSAIISKKAKKVVGIEINESAHLSAEKLKAINKLTNLKNVKGDFNKLVEKYKTADILILDPAKRGCGKDSMQKVKGFKEIIYISCNPIALCKDLNVILNDYEIISVTPFDMFPNTKNVETLIKLKLKEKNL